MGIHGTCKLAAEERCMVETSGNPLGGKNPGRQESKPAMILDLMMRTIYTSMRLNAYSKLVPTKQFKAKDVGCLIDSNKIQ